MAAGNELYIVSGPAGAGGTGSSSIGGQPFVTTTLANGHVTVPASTWKVALVLPKADGDDLSRVSCSTRTIAVIMPNIQTINSDWTTYLTTVDAVEALTGYDFFSNLPEPYQRCIEAGTNGNNPPLVKGNQTITFPQPADSIYGDAPFTVSATGGASGNPVTFAASGACSSSGSNGATITILAPGSCTITASQAGSAIYNAAADVVRTFTVGHAPLSVTAGSATRAYGAANPAFTGTLVGVVAGDDITASYASSATPASVTGAYAIVPSLADPGGRLGNYAVQITNGTLTIGPSTLTVAAANAARSYGAPNPVFTGAVSGVLNGDNISASYGTSASAASAVGTYPITPALVDPDGKLSNYAVSTTSGTLTIGPAALTVTAGDAARTYGAPNPSFTGALSGVTNGDAITATYATTATPASTVGTYAITPTLGDPDGRLGNYSVTSTDGTLTVGSAALVASAADTAREYGAPNPVLTGTLTGVVAGDAITASFTATDVPTSRPGTYSIVVTLNDPGGRLGNYSVTTHNGLLTITDTTPPSLTLPANITGQALSPAGLVVSYVATASDLLDGAVGVTCAPISGAVFAVGATTVRCSSSDAHGNTAQGSFTVTVAGDTAAPVIQSVTPSVTSLWPPNKSMIPVSISVHASDNLDAAPACHVSSVTSNEGSSADWQITGPLTVSLRADRNGNGNGRTYTITVRCTDAFGNTASASTGVVVPHDQRK